MRLLLDAGLPAAPDVVVFDWAIGQERAIVTRDYFDFSHLAEVARRHGRSFPGVLFVSRALRPGDEGAIAAGIEQFVRGVGGGRGGCWGWCGRSRLRATARTDALLTAGG